MEHTHTNPQSPEIKFNVTNFDLDELDFEDMDFKPVTDGLGFHDDRAEKKAKVIPRVKESLKAPEAKKKPINNPNPVHRSNSTTMKPMESRTIHQKDIYEAFYGHKEKTEEVQIAKKEVENKEYETASTFLQFSAWMIDVLFLALAVAFTGGLFALVSGFDRAALLDILSGRDLISFGTCLFTLYYLFYFSVLDLGTSPGKAVMGVRLVRLDGKGMRISQTLVRALVSLGSFIALGVPLLMDFQGKLSDTKVAKL